MQPRQLKPPHPELRSHPWSSSWEAQVRLQDLVRTQERHKDKEFGPVRSHEVILSPDCEARELGEHLNGCCLCRSDKLDHFESTLELDGKFSGSPANFIL